MGIPHYFYILTQEHHDICDINEPGKCDHYFIDFNGMIHQAAATDISPDQIKNASWDYLQLCIQDIKPIKTVHICADGVAPVAKMIQQRKRRYLTVLENQDNKWDKNAISPGTEFMTLLNNYMAKMIRNTVSGFSYHYSGTNEPGEGEHKIFYKMKSVPHDDISIIYGLDADLIMLSLISHHPNIYLMRETMNIKIIESTNKFTYLNIDKLRYAILNQLRNKFQWNISTHVLNNIYSTEANEIIENYVVLCFLLGNDFLPSIMSLSLKKNGHSRLLYAAKSLDATIIKNNEINYQYLIELFKVLSIDENENIFKLNEEYIKKQPYNDKQYAMINKSNIAKLMNSSPSKWRSIYYKELFRSNINDTPIISESCKIFIEGIKWIHRYYKQSPKNDYWYYPYGYAPTLFDLANYLQGNIDNIQDIYKTSQISSDIQLLIILPLKSSHILPEKLRKCMTDTKYGIAHMYPCEYHIETYLKTYLWECIPYLPSIDIELIEKCISIL